MSPAAAPNKVQETLRTVLHEPANYILSRPGKGLRSQLVHLGASLGSAGSALTAEQTRRCAIAARVIEHIHAGSLIVDDVEDGSAMRREAPTLHRQIGVARAINTGNWLYFSPLTTIKEMGLAPAEELQLLRDCLETLSTAHCGQAIDLGTRIDEVPQPEVFQLCQSSLEWKTGEFVGLALRIGAYSAEASPAVRERLHALGKELGVGLQMFDDIGNFAMRAENGMASKRLEDLRNLRPSWVWAYVATHFSPADYAEWIAAVRALPDETALRALSERHQVPARARASAMNHLRWVKRSFETEFPGREAEHAEAWAFMQTLEKAYD